MPPLESGLPPERTLQLDNPIWHALSTGHAAIALGDERAKRYPSRIGPLSGIPAPHEENYAALGALALEDIALLFSLEPFRVPPSWQVLRAMELIQMVRNNHTISGAPGLDFETGERQTRPLTSSDAPAMLALAELTQPGPFRLGTPELGGFVGIFENGRLVSMAGRRIRLPGMVEVSAVCTHPSARGRGYARLLMQRVIRDIEREGSTAFLHSLPDNPAVRLYEQLGFRFRRRFHWAVLKPNPA